MKILVVGSGGREHAMAWKLAQSPKVKKVYVAPGNGGTALEDKVENIELKDHDAICGFASYTDLVIIGPEQPIVDGLADKLSARNILCLAPDQDNAYLEGSKVNAKLFMRRNNIPTAEGIISSALSHAHWWIEKYCDKTNKSLVVKADGLAGGKGVFVCYSKQSAIDSVNKIMLDRYFGSAGNMIIIEECLIGRELSFMVLSDGVRVVPLETSQDYKDLHVGNTGPKTGGMGAFSPAFLTTKMYNRIMTEIVIPTFLGLAKEHNKPYKGFLYFGLMLTNDGPKVLEYNCRLGDPETQVLMTRLNSDFAEICYSAAKGELNPHIEWDPKSSVGVVMTSKGYPYEYETGKQIIFPNSIPNNIKIFHSGTSLKDSNIVSAGGRVLCVTGKGLDEREASFNVYDTVKNIHFNDSYYRNDIAKHPKDAV